MLALAFLPAVAAAQLPSNGEVEGNDTRPEAMTQGPIGYDESHRLYTGTIGTENDVDVFLVYAPKGSTQLNVSLTNTTAEEEADSLVAIIADSDGNELASLDELGGPSTGETEDVGYTVHGPGVFYVGVRTAMFGNTGSANPSYSFTLTANRPLPRTDPMCSAAQTRATSARRKLTKAKAAYRHGKTKPHKRAVRRSKARLRTARFDASRLCSK